MSDIPLAANTTTKRQFDLTLDLLNDDIKSLKRIATYLTTAPADNIRLSGEAAQLDVALRTFNGDVGKAYEQAVANYRMDLEVYRDKNVAKALLIERCDSIRTAVQSVCTELDKVGNEASTRSLETEQAMAPKGLIGLFKAIVNSNNTDNCGEHQKMGSEVIFASSVIRAHQLATEGKLREEAGLPPVTVGQAAPPVAPPPLAVAALAKNSTLNLT